MFSDSIYELLSPHDFFIKFSPLIVVLPTDQMVDNINERTVLTAGKHIFYCAKEQWVTALSQRQDLDLEYLQSKATR